MLRGLRGPYARANTRLGSSNGRSARHWPKNETSARRIRWRTGTAQSGNPRWRWWPSRPGVTWGALAVYPREQLFQEVAYIAYHFHWPFDDVIDMEHEERHVWLRERARINREINHARRR